MSSRKAKSRLNKAKNEGLDLFMECTEEELSDAQVVAFRKAEKEHNEVMKKINNLRAKNVKIIYGNHNTVFPTSTTTPTTSLLTSNVANSEGNLSVPRLQLPIPQQSQQIIIKNAVSSQPTSYKLLLDARTGLILGTLPTESQAILTGNGTANSNPQIPQTLALVPISNSNQKEENKCKTVVISQPDVTSSRLTMLPVVQQSMDGQSVNKPQTHLLNTTKCTSLIKSVKQSKSTDEKNYKQDSDISQTYENLQRAPSQYPSLTIKAIPQRSASPSVFQVKRRELDNTIKEVIQLPPSGLVKWMFEHGLFHIEQYCLIHRSTKMQLIFESNNENDLSGGYKWQCVNCNRSLPIQHRSFFESLGYGLLTMLKIIYFWACNEDVQKVLRETKVSACFLRSVYSLLRSICTCKVKTLSKLGGCESRPVEVCVTLLEDTCMYSPQLYLGCVYERITGMVALRAFNAKTDNAIEEFVKSFVCKSSVINTDRSVRLSNNFLHTEKHKLIAANEQGCVSLNAKAYTTEKVIPMFGNVIKQLQMETIQSFLSELMWREKFGTNPYNAFNNILLHIKQHYGTCQTSNQPVKMPVVTMAVESSSSKLQLNEKNLKRKSEVIDGSSKELILLDDYYYAWQNPTLLWKNKNESETNKTYKFKCHVCKRPFDNNIKVMRHLYAHIENSKQRNLDLSDVTQCKYCFREFETPFQMQCHVEDVHLKNGNPLMCRICDRAFVDKATLINHMHQTHTASEMPYSCEVCKYRCSMYRKLLDHFQQEHNGTNHIQCHYCLKVFSVKFSSVKNIGLTNNFWNHIYKHQTKSLSRKCNACCLTFFGQTEMKYHRLYDHVSNWKKTGVFKFPSTNNESEIYMDEPPVKKPKFVRSKAVKFGSKISRQSKGDFHGGLQSTQMDGLQCFECRSEVKFPDHFLKSMCCSQCCYATNCGKAYANHMIYRHSHSRKKDDNCNAVYLPTKMFCICGFSHRTGNIMAKHLSLCGKRSCYPTWKSAQNATIQPPHNEINLEPGFVQNKNEENQIVVYENVKKVESQEDNPPMLNVLGLMRNTEKVRVRRKTDSRRRRRVNT